MKKIICIVMSLFILGSASFGQENKAQKPPAVKKETTAKQPKEVKPVVEPKANVKQDGTPDKRFKENKKPEKTVKTKKDGTPDMRYKENKQAKEKKPEVKKDSKPEMKK